ncbi:MAG: CRISPR-associated endonuclease Cas1 [Candidatus Krumholzibacteriia bacterium]
MSHLVVGSLPDLVPARMLNEYVYCPRLAWLEWVAAEWADSADTVEGRTAHRAVDRTAGRLQRPDVKAGGEEHTDESAQDQDEIVARAQSITMSAPEEFLIARMDVVEQEGSRAWPVDTKRGAMPDIPGGVWEPEQVQICAQILILRANGFQCDSGYVYFAGSRRQVEVHATDVLVDRTRRYVSDLREAAAQSKAPRPLEDSPKCPRCSLVGICLPDETLVLSGELTNSRTTEIRRLVPGRDDTQPLYLNKQGVSLGKSAGEFVVREKGIEVDRIRIAETAQVCLFGNVQVTTQALQECFSRDIPVLFFTYGGWFKGMTRGLGARNVELRRAQYARAEKPGFCVRLAGRLVSDKIRNSRVLLRRNHRPGCTPVIARLRRHANKAEQETELESLLGIEGTAAREYFAEFAGMFRDGDRAASGFTMDGRNRRPPLDPVNAMLSFAYAMLVKDWTVTLSAVGLDPFLGVYHQPRFGRPALALDMMEPFRPLIADSTVLWVVNNGVLGRSDFVERGGGCALKPDARKKFILAYEQRMDTLITHPVFDYRVSYRRVFEVQARLLARVFTGEIPELPSFVTR